MSTDEPLKWQQNFVSSVERARNERGWTRNELATRLTEAGVPFHQPTVQRIEEGARAVRLNEAEALCRVLDLDFDTAVLVEGANREQQLLQRLRELVRLAEDRERAGGNVVQELLGLQEAIREVLDELGDAPEDDEDRLYLDAMALAYAGRSPEDVAQALLERGVTYPGSGGREEAVRRFGAVAVAEQEARMSGQGRGQR